MKLGNERVKEMIELSRNYQVQITLIHLYEAATKVGTYQERADHVKCNEVNVSKESAAVRVGRLRSWITPRTGGT